jgi:hypothetical protein
MGVREGGREGGKLTCRLNTLSVSVDYLFSILVRQRVVK